MRAKLTTFKRTLETLYDKIDGLYSDGAVEGFTRLYPYSNNLLKLSNPKRKLKQTSLTSGCNGLLFLEHSRQESQLKSAYAEAQKTLGSQ